MAASFAPSDTGPVVSAQNEVRRSRVPVPLNHLPDNRTYLESLLQLGSAARIPSSTQEWVSLQLSGKSSEA